MNIELYIGNRLCDIGNPENLGIYLKRVFIKPSELSVKDAQKSYEISLPATAVNNEIFNYTNVEEVQGKFKVYDDARLYIDGILILDGKFRMSQITCDAYIGNLGVPASKTVVDIFGETMMNQAGKWPLPFNGVEGLTAYNTDGYDREKYGEQSPCLFPFVLYGLLNKYEPNKNYSNKDIYDSSVRFAINDFLPSVNIIHMLKKIFENAEYTLGGSALNDERFKNIYASYKNPMEYELFWGAGEMKVEGNWSSYTTRSIESNRYINILQDDIRLISTNIFQAKNISNIKITDSGSNITRNKDNNILFKVPYTGLYKLEFDVNIELTEYEAGSRGQIGIRSTGFNNDKIEIKVLRNVDLNSLSEETFDNTFFQNNQPNKSDGNGALYPKEGEVNFIDSEQNKNFICGFSWGYDSTFSDHYNPACTTRHNPMAIKGGKSWSNENSERFFSATKNTGYKKRVGLTFEDTSAFKVDLNVPDSIIPRTTQENKKASGFISQVIWLEKGETVYIVSTSRLKSGPTPWCSPSQYLNFKLSLTPFMRDRSWLTVTDDGYSSAPMNWNDLPTFKENEIDLIKFLPSNTKINDWIDNFCKTFNLEIINTGGNNFDLNIQKSKLVTSSSILIDLDKKVDVTQRRNESLNLPYVYELGFTADTGEEGYYETMDDEISPKTGNKTGEKIVSSGKYGKGEYYTGSEETTKLTQNSNFSYCWYKKLIEGSTNFDVPVITDHEVWEQKDAYDYEEMSKKFYPDKNQRFWYKSGTKNILINNEKSATVAMVANEYKGQKNLILDYDNKADSIMKNFFLLLTNNNSNYTIVECYLSPEEYSNLDKTLVKFNGDLYNAAEVDGYDPMNRKKGVLKLIRKMI